MVYIRHYRIKFVSYRIERERLESRKFCIYDTAIVVYNSDLGIDEFFFLSSRFTTHKKSVKNDCESRFMW